jgi:hypothetical protein
LINTQLLVLFVMVRKITYFTIVINNKREQKSKMHIECFPLAS